MPRTTSNHSPSSTVAKVSALHAASNDGPCPDSASFPIPNTDNRPGLPCNERVKHTIGAIPQRIVSWFISKNGSDPEPERSLCLAKSGIRSYKGRPVDSIYCSQKDRLEGADGESAGPANEAIGDGFKN